MAVFSIFPKDKFSLRKLGKVFRGFISILHFTLISIASDPRIRLRIEQLIGRVSDASIELSCDVNDCRVDSESDSRLCRIVVRDLSTVEAYGPRASDARAQCKVAVPGRRG